MKKTRLFLSMMVVGVLFSGVVSASQKNQSSQLEMPVPDFSFNVQYKGNWQNPTNDALNLAKQGKSWDLRSGTIRTSIDFWYKTNPKTNQYEWLQTIQVNKINN